MVLVGKFGRLLEERAREVLSSRKTGDFGPSVQLEEELELVVDQLSDTRKWVEDETTRLVWLECYVGTDLMTLYTLLGSAYWLSKARHNLKMKVIELKEQRHEVTHKGHLRILDLEERLLKALHRLEYLK